MADGAFCFQEPTMTKIEKAKYEDVEALRTLLQEALAGRKFRLD